MIFMLLRATVIFLHETIRLMNFPFSPNTCTVQVIVTDPMTEEHLRCNEKVMSEGDEEPEATEEEAEVLSAAQAAVSADNDSGEGDEPQDGEDKTESDNEMEEEEGGDEDYDYENEDGRQKRYERDFLLSLQFLEQCKKRPPNLMNAEYIRKVLVL